MPPSLLETSLPPSRHIDPGEDQETANQHQIFVGPDERRGVTDEAGPDPRPHEPRPLGRREFWRLPGLHSPILPPAQEEAAEVTQGRICRGVGPLRRREGSLRSAEGSLRGGEGSLRRGVVPLRFGVVSLRPGVAPLRSGVVSLPSVVVALCGKKARIAFSAVLERVSRARGWLAHAPLRAVHAREWSGKGRERAGKARERHGKGRGRVVQARQRSVQARE